MMASHIYRSHHLFVVRSALLAAALLALAGCGNVASPPGTDAASALADGRPEVETTAWLDAGTDEGAGLAELPPYPDIDTHSPTGPQSLVVLPVTCVGSSSGGGWKLAPRGLAAAPVAQASSGGTWILTGATIGGGQ